MKRLGVGVVGVGARTATDGTLREEDRDPIVLSVSAESGARQTETMAAEIEVGFLVTRFGYTVPRVGVPYIGQCEVCGRLEGDACAEDAIGSGLCGVVRSIASRWEAKGISPSSSWCKKGLRSL